MSLQFCTHSYFSMIVIDNDKKAANKYGESMSDIALNAMATDLLAQQLTDQFIVQRASKEDLAQVMIVQVTVSFCVIMV